MVVLLRRVRSLSCTVRFFSIFQRKFTASKYYCASKKLILTFCFNHHKHHAHFDNDEKYCSGVIVVPPQRSLPDALAAACTRAGACTHTAQPWSAPAKIVTSISQATAKMCVPSASSRPRADFVVRPSAFAHSLSARPATTLSRIRRACVHVACRVMRARFGTTLPNWQSCKLQASARLAHNVPMRTTLTREILPALALLSHTLD